LGKPGLLTLNDGLLHTIRRTSLSSRFSKSSIGGL
jgi:hypothetical protein